MSVAIAAPHAEAVAAGRRAVARGGNAIDAALAAAATLTVVYPHQCAIGGDAIALVRSPAGETTAVIAAGTAPSAIAGVSATWTEVPHLGAHSVTVPGMVAGWRAISRLGARHGLAAALEYAAEAAERGTRVSRGLARAIVARDRAVLSDPGMRGVFTDSGSPLAEGDLLRQPALADTMRALAKDPDEFYIGQIAESLVDTLRAAGGVHTAKDFADYAPEVRPALTRMIGERTWHVAPPPSVGAILIGLAAHEEEHASGDTTSTSLVDAVVRGVHTRASSLGDPRSSEIDVDVLVGLGAESLAVLFTEPRPYGDTAAVTTLDDDGWGVTIVQSVYQSFGAGLLDPNTGILFHNRGSAFSVDRASPAFIRPGARPPHTLCPVIVDAPSATVVAGCQGGRAQAWILAQVLPDALDPGNELQTILTRPRWVIGDRDLDQPRLSLVAEPGVAPAVLNHADDIGLGVVHFPGFGDEAGHVQLVRAVGHDLRAASDPRADGLGVVIDPAHEGSST